MDYPSIKIKCEKFENIGLGRMLLSHSLLTFFYGIFLFVYEVKFFNECSHAVHPVLIIWSVLIILYDTVIRNIWKRVPYWNILILFAFSAGVTAILTLTAGGIGNIKAWILTSIPLFVFYPTCFLQPEGKKEKTFLIVMSGAAVVSCLASGIAIWMYFIRFSGTITFSGITDRVGIVHYLPSDPNSAILLYGLYTDTNHAAIYALFFIFYGILLLYFSYQEKNKWIKLIIRVFAVIDIIIQACYFPLANSRGGFLSMGVSIFIVSFLYSICRIFEKRNNLLKFILSIGCAVVIVIISCFVFWSIRTGLSHLSVKVESEQRNKKAQNENKKNSNIEENNDAKNELEKNNKIDSSLEKGEEKKQIYEPEEDSFVKKNENFGAGRLEIWKDTIILIKHRPIMGEGPGNKSYYAPIYSADGVIAQKGSEVHNSYFDLILDYGIVGGAILLTFWILCAIRVLKCLLIEKKQFNLWFYLCVAIILVSASGAILISSAFINVTALYFIMVFVTGYVISKCID